MLELVMLPLLLPDWLDPAYITHNLGNWALWGVALIIFIECAIFPVLPGDSLLFTVGMFIAMIPPSITFILYGIATETSIGRLFLAGVMPGLMLTLLFMAWTIGYLWLKGFRAYAADFRYSWREKLQSIPKVAVAPLFVVPSRSRCSATVPPG